jgi:hypothetical protein
MDAEIGAAECLTLGHSPRNFTEFEIHPICFFQSPLAIDNLRKLTDFKDFPRYHRFVWCLIHVTKVEPLDWATQCR